MYSRLEPSGPRTIMMIMPRSSVGVYSWSSRSNRNQPRPETPTTSTIASQGAARALVMPLR